MKAVYTVLVLVGLCAMPGSGKCKTEEVEMCTSLDPPEGCFCKMCISCPKGFGPTHQCGGRYWNGTIIKCKTCPNGVSYSEEDSIASCQPCRQCGGRETSRNCTPNSDTICSNNCRVGYIMNDAVEDCVLDPTSQQIDTAKLITQLPGTTTIHKNTQKNSHGTTTTTKPIHSDKSGRDGQSNSKDHSRDNKIIIVTVIVIGTVIVIVTVGFILYCCLKKVACFRRNNARNQDEEIALTDKNSTSPRSSQEIVPPWPIDLRLSLIPQALRSDVTNYISESSPVVKGWQAIGEDSQINLTQFELQAIRIAGKKQGTNEGEELLIKLVSFKPELTLMKFVKVLENVGRKDVVDIIYNFYNNEIKINDAVQIDQESQNDQLDDV
ncbi:uncharacterized protein LOC116291449 [Actinia tenebrosa]|uniref:Uncharacterized protein LOC116291449 n=1 Tax=Actinia tenebrosa TaxID=6105 RepID=A0A6P8HHP5_ACTTE|nr:uncharacterized protein LOC116291449 [Actinia tenebrosa]